VRKPIVGCKACRLAERMRRRRTGEPLGRTPRARYARAMCGRARLSSDVSEIKLVFSIPPHRPTPNIPPSCNVAPTDPLPFAV
jgi:hypothetical protein